jgi:hypothetical protein
MKCVNDASEAGGEVKVYHQPPVFFYFHVRGQAANLVSIKMTHR